MYIIFYSVLFVCKYEGNLLLMCLAFGSLRVHEFVCLCVLARVARDNGPAVSTPLRSLRPRPLREHLKLSRLAP